jgi:hypothetical protein
MAKPTGRPNGRPQGSSVARAIAFGVWAAAQPRVPTLFDVMAHTGLSRISAGKWRRCFLKSIPADITLKGQKNDQ